MVVGGSSSWLCRPAALLQVLALFPVRRDLCRTARFAFASLFCRNFSTQIGVRAAKTAVLARSSAILLAVPPVTQPPQENPITIDATAPIAIPCRRRVRDSPCRIEGTCMAFGLSIRGMCAARASATTSSVLNAAEPNATVFGVLLCLPKAPALPRGENGDFGTSPIYGQLSHKPLLVVCILSILTWWDVKHNRGSRTKSPMHLATPRNI